MPHNHFNCTSNQLQVGVIGAGWIADLSHGPALREYAQKHPQIRLRAVSDVVSERSMQFASKFGFERSYANAEEMLEKENLQAVYVLVPDRLMSRVAILPLERGIPTLLEKPPGKSPEEILHLIDVAAKMETPHVVGFNRRCLPLLVAMRQRLQTIQEETGGVPELVSYLFSRHGRFDADFSTTAIHPVDTVSFLVGSPYESLRIDYHKEESEMERGDNFLLFGRSQAGTRISIEITPDAGMNCERVDVHFPGRSLNLAIPCVKGVDGTGYLQEYYQGRLISTVSGDSMPKAHNDGFYAETELFLGGLLAGHTSFPGHDLSSALQSVAIMQAIENRQSVFRSKTTTLEREFLPSR